MKNSGFTYRKPDVGETIIPNNKILIAVAAIISTTQLFESARYTA